MPQMEVLGTTFPSPLTKRGIERHMSHTLIMTYAALLNIRSFTSGGETTYLEAVLLRIHAALPEKF